MRDDAFAGARQDAAQWRRPGVVDVQERRFPEQARHPALVRLEPGEEPGVESDLSVPLEQDHREVAAHAPHLAAPLLGRLEVTELLVEHAAEDDAGNAHRARPRQRFRRCARAPDDDPSRGSDVDGARPQLVAGLVHAPRSSPWTALPLPPTPATSAPATRSSIGSGSRLMTSPRTWPRTGSLPESGAIIAEPSSRS